MIRGRIVEVLKFDAAHALRDKLHKDALLRLNAPLHPVDGKNNGLARHGEARWTGRGDYGLEFVHLRRSLYKRRLRGLSRNLFTPCGGLGRFELVFEPVEKAPKHGTSNERRG